ncbi:MAG: sigma-70 family RNA polymerase sigma factor [Rhodothermales bacterium]
MIDDDTTTSVTQLLQKAQTGDEAAVDLLFARVYDTLKALARRQREQWQGDYTLNTTAIVHEAYLKLFDQKKAEWESQTHFLSVASKAMRHILVDYARRRKAEKRGGNAPKVSLDEVQTPSGDVITITEEKADSIVALDKALERLSAIEPREAQVVECRFFGGMTIAETASALGVSPMTVKRDWAMAQAWLLREMKSEQ